MLARIGFGLLTTIAIGVLTSNAGFTADVPRGVNSNDPVQQLQSRVEALRKEGKNEEADRLQIQIGQAIKRIPGMKPVPLPELHMSPVIQEAPEFQEAKEDPPEKVMRAARSGMNPSRIPKEQRVRSLLAAAASLKAAGLEEDANRYTRMAVQLAQEGTSAEVAALRQEVEQLRGEVQRLRGEVERLQRQNSRMLAPAPSQRPHSP